MERRDYLLKEIEKIRMALAAILQKFYGGKAKENAATTKIENTKGELLDEINFDLDKFLDLNVEESNEYIFSFVGFNVENIELLAKCLSEIGFTENCNNSKKYLEKSLQLYKLCNSESKTYSFERETSINLIQNALQLEK